MISPYASITWGRNRQGRLVPLAVSYDEPVIETKTIVRRDIQASTAEREVKSVSLARITAFEKFIELSEREVAVAAKPSVPRQAATPKPADARADLIRIARIKAANERLQRAGLIPCRGDAA